MSRMKETLGDTPYPDRPGYREPVTSKAAAEAIAATAETIRADVLAALKVRPATVHETAERLGRPVPSIQPRFSELRAKGLIEPTGERRINRASGQRAHVWRAT